jgi:hypothetical protein
MAPINTLSVLAFATAALAVPYHGHGHAKYHNNKPSGFVYSYANANGTGIYGTGLATGTGAAVAPASETAVVSDVEFTTEMATTYADATTTCTSDVTITSTVKKTVTVTASASSDVAPVESSSSSEASPVLSSSESSAPSYSAAPTSYSSKAEAVTQAAYSSPAPSSSASSASESSSAASMTFSAANKNVDVNVGYGSSSSSSSAPSSTSASSYGGQTGGKGKRGVSYNDAKLTDCLTSSSKISWGYNWGSSSDGLSAVSYVPTLWGTNELYTDSWSKNAQSAIESGSTHLFSFNEPDMGEQSNLSPQAAASAWKQYMEPFAGKAQLCSPSVTNGGGSMGLSWLKSFLESCSDCTIDCLNIHWYDSAENVDYFKKHIGDAADLAPGKPIFVSEFAATGDQETFLETVMPWMDSNDAVAGYAYFKGDGVLVSGNEMSSLGQIYAS